MTVDPYCVKQVLDVQGLRCPWPVLKARCALRALQPGEVLRIVATDPGVLDDIPLLVQQTGDTLLEVEQQDNGLCVLDVQRGGRGSPTASADG